MAAAPPATGPATTQAATQPVAEQVAELVPQLSADDFKQRQSAQEKPSARTDDAVPALRAARESATDPETRGRLDSDKEIQWSLYLRKENGGPSAAAAVRKTGEPPKLVLPFALEVKDVTVPFEFHGCVTVSAALFPLPVRIMQHAS